MGTVGNRKLLEETSGLGMILAEQTMVVRYQLGD